MSDQGIITVEAEEIPLEKKVEGVIKQELIKGNITEAVIAELKEKYLPLTINGQEDKEGFLAVQEARKEVKRIRILAERICKKGREQALLEQKLWVTKEKEVVAKFSEVEDYLEKQEKDWEKERDRIKAEKKKKQDEAFILRQAELTKFGATYLDGSFVLEDVSYEVPLLREADDETYAIMRDQYKVIFDSREVARLEQERIKAEEDQKREAERVELEQLRKDKEAQEAQRKAAEEEAKKQKEIDDEIRYTSRFNELKGARWNPATQAAYADYNHTVCIATKNALLAWSNEEWHTVRDVHNKKVEEIAEARRQDEEKRVKEIEEQRKAEAERAERYQGRIAKLYELGLGFDYSTRMFINYDVSLPAEDIKGYEDEKWDQVLETTTRTVEAFKIRQEGERKAREEADKEAAIAKALKEEEEKRNIKKSEDERLALEAAERLTASNDKEKWNHLVASLQSVDFPEFKSSQYRKKANDLKNQLNAL